MLKKTFITILSAVFGFAALPAGALAEPGQIGLKGEVFLEKTVDDNGKPKKVLVEPKVVLPGDRLLFGTAYVNNGNAPVEHFVVTNPLPAAVMLAPESASGLDVSVDGGKTYGRLAALTVSDGQGGTRPAAPADVSHVRWIIPAIAPHAQGKVEFFAIVR